MREKNMVKVLGAGLAIFGMAGAANAAIYSYAWEGGTQPVLDIGQQATLNVYVQLQPDPPLPPPGPNDEMGFLLYVLTDFAFANAPNHIIEPVAYVDPLAPDYGYLNFVYPAPTGLTGSQLVHEQGTMKTYENTGGAQFLVGQVVLEALPCPLTPEVADDILVFVGDPSSDLAMFRGDLITPVAVTNSVPDGLLLTNTCVPEPASLALIALGGLAMLRRRR